jgi:peptide-methionine (S)-S-oxide reductase
MQETNNNTLETATLGGGCFWCIEALFDSLNGVETVVSGYAGGSIEAPTYRAVCNGNTGHAEVVQLFFDPAVLSYADLLRLFLLMHNPTTMNRQGADTGSQYRSIILYHNEEQQQTARAVFAELQPCFDKPIVTEVSPYTQFFKAEEHHQQYYKRDPAKAYCQTVINPKLAKLRQQFTALLKKEAAS